MHKHTNRRVAVLFARRDSVYKTLPVDVWDEDRDARKFTGGAAVIAHPPCRLWGRLRHFAKAKHPDMEKQLAVFAVAKVRENGGVLEHPASSTLWLVLGLPKPHETADKFGGFTLEVNQCDWGHRAQKKTWLYVVGCTVPAMPPPGKPTGVVHSRTRSLPQISKPEREHTPINFANWLVQLAKTARVQQ